MDAGLLDPGLVILAIVGLLFLGLVGAAIRKMVRGRLEEGKKPDALEAGDDDALAKEAEDAGRRLAAGEPAEAEEPDEAQPGKAEPGKAGKAEPGKAGKAETGSAGKAETGSAGKAETGKEPRAEAASSSGEAMQRGLEKTRKGFMARLNALLFKGGLDEDLADDLESLLVTSDIGIRTAEKLLGDLRTELSKKEIKDGNLVRERLRARIFQSVNQERPPMSWDAKPTVIMVIGVNGVGKTTTIGKLAARLVKSGKKVVLGAGDTFRAAAVEQLEVWGERAGAEVVKGTERADPSAVIFDAVSRALAVGADVCLCDTAGRLHTKVNLMEELKKVRRVMNKAMPGAPHEVLLVLDATTGQNAISQAKQFKEAVEVTSLALTKLDGTAKGGVVVAICDELQLPVRFVGVGEKVDDLRDFDPTEFVDALFARDEEALERAG